MNWNSKQFWVDGGCRGNHKPAGQPREAYGSISDGEDVTTFPLDIAHTNNQAEIMSLNRLLLILQGYIDPLKAPVTIHMDSALVVDGINKNHKIKAPGLKTSFTLARGLLLDSLSHVKLKRVPRYQIEARVGH